ncbi:MAG: MFS transporter [Pseudomonadota bacterium]
MTDSTATDAGAAGGAQTQKVGLYSYYVVTLLTIAYVFNFIDRQIVGIASPGIKEDLDLSDAQLGLLKGFAFALLYTIAGIPIARWADRSSRVRIVSLAVVVWSGFTAISGFANNFWQMLLARIGVGIGEAGCSPPSHSIISDYFPKEQRATALGIYSLGIPIGIMLAYLAGGLTIAYFGWRTAFIVVGLPGVLLGALIYFTVREPERGAMDGPAVAPKPSDEGYTLYAAARHVFSIPTYFYACAGITAASFTGYAATFWVVDFYRRSHPDLPFETLVLMLGLISGLAYGLGTFFGGYLTERAAQKDKRYYMLFPSVAMLLAAPLMALQLFAADVWMSLMYVALFQILMGVYLAPSFAMVQILSPVAIRALSTAVFFFVLNIIALGFGPTFVGVVSDFYITSVYGVDIDAVSEEVAKATQSEALRWALFWSGFGLLLASAFYWRASRFIVDDWRKATGES